MNEQQVYKWLSVETLRLTALVPLLFQLMWGVTVRAVQNTAPARQIVFNRDIRPILADRCWSAMDLTRRRKRSNSDLIPKTRRPPTLAEAAAQSFLAILSKASLYAASRQAMK